MAAAYGVEPRVQVAVWGLESNFGRFSGVRPVIPSLATLAYDDRRRGLFRGELLDALTILDSGDMQHDELKGSWAGAMGQTQFLPSSYLAWAVDFDNDGRRNIWSSEPDVFGVDRELPARTRLGEGRTVGIRRDGAGACGQPCRGSAAPSERLPRRPRSQRASIAEGMEERSASRPARGATPVPSSTRPASLLRIDNRAWLVTANYEALLGYNCAHTYALSVATLADRLATR